MTAKEHRDGADPCQRLGPWVHALTQADLVDEYRAMVHPVLIADGLRMFRDPADMLKLRLTDNITYDSGGGLVDL